MLMISTTIINTHDVITFIISITEIFQQQHTAIGVGYWREKEKAVLLQEEPRDASVNFDTYRSLGYSGIAWVSLP